MKEIYQVRYLGPTGSYMRETTNWDEALSLFNKHYDAFTKDGWVPARPNYQMPQIVDGEPVEGDLVLIRKGCATIIYLHIIPN